MIRLFFRRLAGKVSKLFLKGYSDCGRCGRPYPFGKRHSTPYTPGKGCFPLCEACWSELNRFSRVPYYIELFEDWNRQDPLLKDEKLEEIVKAVLSGK